MKLYLEVMSKEKDIPLKYRFQWNIFYSIWDYENSCNFTFVWFLIRLGRSYQNEKKSNTCYIRPPNVAAITALIVCIRFSASSKTMD